MKQVTFTIVVLIAVVALFVLVTAQQEATSGSKPAPIKMDPSSQVSNQPQTPLAGAELFKQNCAVCHGENGRGDGTASAYLFPKPRDFTRAIYKIQSTPVGDLPTDEDLFKTLTHGMPGSAMPSFAHLPEQDRKHLVDHIKSLAVIILEDGTQVRPFEMWDKRVIAVPAEPPVTAQTLKQGRELYVKKGCINCHGDTGRGDGPSAQAGFKDDWGYPIIANNFTRGIYKGGGETRDIYLRFSGGMGGTPMPSFKDIMNDEERWAMVQYVRSLAGNKVAAQSSQKRLVARRVSQPFVLNPNHPIWDKIEPVEIPLMLTWQRQEAPETLRVRIAHNGSHLAYLLEWDDPTVNSSVIRPQDFTDGVAVETSEANPPPQFTMGEKGKPVHICFWRMDRQMDMARFADIEWAYPGMVSDGIDHERVEKRSPWSDPDFFSGRAAGNTMSNPARLTAVESLKAEGFGTLAPLPEDHWVEDGVGVWTNGTWRVIIRFPMTGMGAHEKLYAPGSTVPVAFAVWDGARQDRNGKKLVTPWQTLEIEK